MKSFIILLLTAGSFPIAAAQQLKGVTFGFGIGYSKLFQAPNEYFLTTDPAHKLQVQPLNSSGLAISSMVTIKFSKISKDAANPSRIVKTGTSNAANFGQRLSLNVAFNLAEINNGDVAFNKSIDGGIGLGCFLNNFTQIAIFLDFIRHRQMRDYVVETYKDKSIPNGSEIFNALDESNSSLYYNKYFPGLSFKVIFSLGND